MIALENDYSQGAHPQIIKKLVDINLEANSGYGIDKYCELAKKQIRSACECLEADIFFISGGTQTNQLVIDTMLDSSEGVIAAQTGHVALHEAGAIEYSGHKVITIPSENGKIKLDELSKFLKLFKEDPSNEHVVQPGMVYISQPTEYGTMYSREELMELRKICDAYDLPLYADGARLIYGLASKDAVQLPELARLCDVFYIGGTKAGTLYGEAVVFTKKNTPKHFFTKIKQHGALMAKGWLMGAMFAELFTDDLYKEIGKTAIDAAIKLRQILAEKSYNFFIASDTNQSFPIIEDKKLEELSQIMSYTVWERFDDTHTVIRLATSWATQMDEIISLKECL